MNEFAIIIGLIVSYIIGSVPTAVWIGKAFYNLDVREHGSGNPGATNTFRVLGKKAGTIVMLGDITKGLVATSLVIILYRLGIVQEQNIILYKLIFGITAVIGHVFSLFINFKGGKGVATLLGMMIAIQYEVALICIVVFLITLIISKYVSLSSILAVLTYPILLMFAPHFKTNEPILIVFGLFLFVIVVWTHNKNIRRILGGEENKTYLIKSKNR